VKPFQKNFLGRRRYGGAYTRPFGGRELIFHVLPLEGGWCVSFNLCAFGSALNVIAGYRREE